MPKARPKARLQNDKSNSLLELSNVCKTNIQQPDCKRPLTRHNTVRWPFLRANPPRLTPFAVMQLCLACPLSQKLLHTLADKEFHPRISSKITWALPASLHRHDSSPLAQLLRRQKPSFASPAIIVMYQDVFQDVLPFEMQTSQQ